MTPTAQKALITGGTKGIGLAIASSLVDQGTSVAISARTQVDIDKAVQSLAARGKTKVFGIPADLSIGDECEKLVSTAAASLGGLDILINNAGIGILKSIEELSWQEWRQQIDLNLGGVWACTKAALPHLKASGNAWVINIGSLASVNSFPGGTGYNASKFGLLGMTEAMMHDLRAQEIRVSIVMPGSVNTEFSGKTPSAERSWKLEADDCALAVVQLLSYPKGAHASRIELRPAVPRKK